MRKMLPVVLLVTVLPTILLTLTALYIGQAFQVQAEGAPAVPEFRSSSFEDDDDGWELLFDGKSLKGWEGNEMIFRIENNAIVGGDLKNNIPQNEFLCTTKQYEDFELRLQAKLLGQGRNAGIQFRSKRVPDHHEVIGYQCDIGRMSDRTIWGSLYDESRRRKFLAEGDSEKTEEATKVEQWNDLVIRCEGNRIQIWVNGYQTVDFTEPDKKIPRKGIIGLQIHGGKPAEAWYRSIRLKKLNA